MKDSMDTKDYIIKTQKELIALQGERIERLEDQLAAYEPNRKKYKQRSLKVVWKQEKQTEAARAAVAHPKDGQVKPVLRNKNNKKRLKWIILN